MTSPKTPQQLASEIESLVASYVDEVRRVAQASLDQAFAKAIGKVGASSRTRRTDRSEGRVTSKRRSPDEIDEIGERLYDLVCARPGESMTVFSEEIGLPVPALHRPMWKLKTEGRVRCVGERNLARYFPALARRSKNADA